MTANRSDRLLDFKANDVNVSMNFIDDFKKLFL